MDRISLLPSTSSAVQKDLNINHEGLIISISSIGSIGEISLVLIYLRSCSQQILFREIRKAFMSRGSGFNPSPEQLQAIIDTGIWWNHKVQELRDAERFEDAYALLQEFDVITSRSLQGVNKKAPPEREVAVMEIRQRGDGYGKVASAMGMTTSMFRRII